MAISPGPKRDNVWAGANVETMSTDIVTYCNCMEEVRLRISLVQSILVRSVTTGHDGFDAELVFVQLRKTLEQVALASLAANRAKYSAAFASFATHWNATRMLKALEEVNQNYYPVPVTRNLLSTDEEGHRHWHLEYLTDGFLDKDEFVSLYNICGRILHARNPFDPRDPVIQLDYSVEQWVSRIQKLLAMHIVHLVDSDNFIVAIPNEGKVHAYPYRPVNG
jgi:hypothetical protein